MSIFSKKASRAAALAAALVTLTAAMQSLSLFSAAAVVVWDGSVATAFAGGSGTASDPYQIQTPDQLAFLAERVNARDEVYQAASYRLMADFTLSKSDCSYDADTGLISVLGSNGTFFYGTGQLGNPGGNADFDDRASRQGRWYAYDNATYVETTAAAAVPVWTPIGSSFQIAFSGSFDGNGHHISGLFANGSGFQGLFGCIDTRASIKNLQVSGTSFGTSYNVAGVCAYHQGTLESVGFTGIVCGNGSVGGICGQNNSGRIGNCTVSGVVLSTSNQSGGICGVSNSGYVDYCRNSAGVIGGYYCGGICGAAFSTQLTNCTNSGSIDTEAAIGSFGAGGICGEVLGGYMQNVVNTGHVFGHHAAGGICGMVNDFTMSHCVNAGAVSALSYAGGICGQALSSLLTFCDNTGDVSGAAQVGGVCGWLQSTDSVKHVVLGCTNTGTVTGSTERIGGLCGFGEGENASLLQCSNAGAVLVRDEQLPSAGGLCGEFQGSLTDCLNSGSVLALVSDDAVTVGAAGLVGTGAATTRFVTCCNSGAVAVSRTDAICAALCGTGGASDAFTDCYYLADSAATACGYPVDAAEVTPLQTYSTAALAGFDFANVWEYRPEAFGRQLRLRCALQAVVANTVYFRSVDDAVGYRIYLNGAYAARTVNLSYAFQNLMPGECYMVSVYGEMRDGSLAQLSAGQPFYANEQLAKPTGLKRSGTGIRWDAAGAANGYCVTVIDADTGKFLQQETVAAPEYTARLGAGSYRLRVCAVDAYSYCGSSVTTAAFAVAPPRQTNGNAVTWGDNGAAAYEIYLNGKYATTTANTSYAFQNLTAGTACTVTVRSVFADGESVELGSVALTAVSQLARPTGLRRSGNTIRWNAVQGAARYRVYVIDAETNRILSINSNVRSTRYAFRTLTAGQRYRLRVCAMDADGVLGRSATTGIFMAE